MAVLFSGIIGTTPAVWQDVADLPWTTPLDGTDELGFINGGQVTGNLVGAIPANYSGDFLTGFKAEYYDRIHVTPSEILLGNITAGQVREFYIWNAFLEASKTLQTITPTGDDTGIELVQPDALPSLYGPLELKTYQFNFSTNGPATINVVYTLDFTDAQRTITITGRRAILFGFNPNWGDPITETLEWLTQIIETEEGLEYRQRLRGNPRRTFEYAVGFTDAEKRKLEQYIFAWKARPFILPIWTDCQKLSAPLPSGSLVINISTDNLSYYAGGLLCVLTDPLTTEVLEIDSVSPTQITLTGAVIKDWPEGAKIMPAITAQMPEVSRLSRVTSNLTTGTVRFNCLGNQAVPAVDGPVTHQGLSVLEDKPEMGEDQEVSWESKLEIVDTGPYDPFYDIRADLNDEVDGYRFYIYGRDEIWRWREWLHAREGRFSQFFMPSWSRDFVVVDNIASAQTQIEVEDGDYTTFYDLHPVKRDIMILTKQSGAFYRRITSAAKSVTPGQESLGIDSSLGVDLTPDDILIVCFLHPSRLNADTVELAWQTPDQAILTFSTRAVEQ